MDDGRVRKRTVTGLLRMVDSERAGTQVNIERSLHSFCLRLTVWLFSTDDKENIHLISCDCQNDVRLLKFCISSPTVGFFSG